MQSDLQNFIAEQIDVIHSFQDDWDDKGSKKPNSASLEIASTVLFDLLKQVTQNGYLWVAPHIRPDEDGCISIQLNKGQHDLHFEVRDNCIEFIKVWGANIESEMQSGSLQKEDCLELWKWLLRG